VTCWRRPKRQLKRKKREDSRVRGRLSGPADNSCPVANSVKEWHNPIPLDPTSQRNLDELITSTKHKNTRITIPKKKTRSLHPTLSLNRTHAKMILSDHFQWYICCDFKKPNSKNKRDQISKILLQIYTCEDAIAAQFNKDSKN